MDFSDSLDKGTVIKRQTSFSFRLFNPLSLILFVILLAVLVPVACSGKKTAEQGQTQKPLFGGTGVIGYLYEPDTLNPLITDYAGTSDIAGAILPNFFTVTPEMGYEPSLLEEDPTAENGGITKNPFTIKYRIKKEAKWSDGKPVSSKDVKFSWEMVKSEDGSVQSGYDFIDKIDTPDEKTAVVQFKQPYAAWKDLWSGNNFIYPEHILLEKDVTEEWNEEIPVSAGPYKFSEWKQGQITLARNENYWGEKPYLDKIIFRYSDDTDTLVNQLRAGEVDLVFLQASPGMVERIKKLERLTVQTRGGVRVEAIGFNVEKEPVSDVNIRKAIAYSIDKKTMIEAVMRDVASPLESIIVPQQKDFFAPVWSKYKKDISKAKELVEKSGYKMGKGGYFEKGGKRLSVVVSTMAGVPHREQIEQVMQSDLKEAGIELKIKNTTPETLYDVWFQNGDYQISISGWETSPDPSSNNELFAGDQFPPDGQNVTRYSNEKVSELLKAQDSEVDLKKRADIVKQIQTLIAEDLPVIPLSQPHAILAHKNELTGPEVNPTAEGMLWNVSKWWLQE